MASNSKKYTLARLIFLTIAIMAAWPQAAAVDASYYARSSRLASGTRWVKVKVTQTGVHRITYDQLRQWGFQNPAQVNVYGFSGSDLYDNDFSTSAPDDLPMQYSEHSGDAVYFFGEGDVRLSMLCDYDLRRRRNHYAPFTCYFLSDADPAGMQREPMPYVNNTNTATNHLSIDYHEPEEFRPAEAGVFWFSNPLRTGDSRTFTFHAEDFVSDAFVSYQPVSNCETRRNIEVTLGEGMERISNNYNAISHNSGDDSYLIYNSLPSPSNVCVGLDKDRTEFTATFNGPTDNSWTAIDYAAMLYRRHNRLADHTQLLMYMRNIGSKTNVRISEAKEGTRVWNVSAPLTVTPMETRFDADNGYIFVTPASSAPLLYAVFNPGEGDFPTPEFAEVVTPAENLHGEEADFDMLIITNSMLIDQARRLAALHEQHQGLKVKVVDHRDIFNEFSSGMPSAIAYRRYVKMLHDRNPGMLKYLLLFGHGTSDHRFITTVDDGSYIFTYQVEEDRAAGYCDWTNFEVTNFSSDNYFGMLDDSFTIRNVPRQKAAIAVGRIPAENPAHAAKLVDRVEKYLDTYLTSDNFSRMLAIGDESDENAHLAMAEEAVGKVLAQQPAVMPMKIYLAIYRDASTTDANLNNWRRELTECTDAGAGLMTYCGHSATNVVATAFDIPTANAFKPQTPSIGFFATCTLGFIDRPETSLGSALLNHKNGLVALIAAGRTVYLNRNKALLNAFLDNYYNPAAGDCLGDSWRKGFNQVIDDADITYGLNSLSYNLIGDPALPLPRRTHSAVISSINGKTVASAEIAAKAGTPVTVSGTINTSAGAVDTRFNGQAVVTIYDGRQTVTTKGLSYDPSTDVEINHWVLARTGVKVENGRWSATLVPPAGSVSGSSNMIQVWAAANDNSGKIALGNTSVLSLADNTEESAADTSGPQIREMYIDSPDFRDGDAVGSNFNLHALFADDSGINISNAALGRRLTISLDGANATTIGSNLLRWQYDGTAVLDYPFTNIADGPHTLSLNVSDNLGNTSSASLAFTVVNNYLNGTLSIDNRIVTGKAVINIDIPSTAKLTRLVVEDAAHNTVLTRSLISFPWRWEPDAKLPDGKYYIRAYFTDATRKGATPPLDIILIRK